MARGNGGNARLDSVTCRVDEVSGRNATVIDQYSIFRTVRTDVRRGAGPKPREGETWVIDRSMGVWTFSARIMAKIETPIVTGSTDENPALISLLEALDELGFIKNETIDTQLRAVHPHTHPHTHEHIHDVPYQPTTEAGFPVHDHGVPEQDTGPGDSATAEGTSDTSEDTPDTDDDDPVPP